MNRQQSRLLVALALSAVCATCSAERPTTDGADKLRGVEFVKHVIGTETAISVAALDVDGDGRLDVVAAGGPHGGRSEWANRVLWYKAPKWEKGLVCEMDKEEIILHAEAVDFVSTGPAKGNRPPQITVTAAVRGQIWWYWYDREAGMWSGVVIVEDAQNAHGTAVGDIDRDGYVDLLVPTQRGKPTKGMIWARNPGTREKREKLWPKYPLAETFDIAGWQHYVRLADISGDGRLDALLGSSDRKGGWFGFWLQGKSPTAPWQARALPGPMRQATNLDAADLNGDGRLDLVGTEGHGVGIWWFPAPDYKPIRIDETLKSAHCLALGDLDGDGSTDIASCGYESKQVACFLNRGDGTFSRASIDDDQCAYDASAVDLDKDGDLDILLAGQKSHNVVWYENRQPEK